MNPDRWKRLESAYYQYGDLGDAERARFLDGLEESDPELKAELLKMVSGAGPKPQFLDPPTSAPGLGLAEDPPVERLEPGTRLGAFRVLDWIASGGMGAVYRAERADHQFEQTVAVKVLKAGVTDPTLRQRFHQERQTLAFLNHPLVAKLIDGGNTDDGLPYLVMEYVDGLPIDRYCDEHSLSIEARLALFASVCDGVHHLHQNLVVHRDIKPNNILVDDAGRPKLLDFGIAKLLDQGPRATDADATLPGVRLMTPQFASPEQIRGESVTTASDVYSLGVLLYRLLCGHEPYRLDDGPLHEFERAVCETDPERPSTAVRRVRRNESGGEAKTTTPDGIARERSTSVDRLRRKLSGDIDTVVLMAMQKDPADRYGSAQQFAEDVRRVIEHRPVIARRAPLWCRVVKFAQRNRLGAALAAALLISLVAGAGGILWWAGRTVDESRRADREAETARIEARNVRELNAFLNEMLTSVQPGELGVDAKVRDVLDQAAARLHDELSNNPTVEARLRVTLGQSYLGLGELGLAEVQFREGLAVARAVYGAEDPNLATFLNHLAQARVYVDELREADRLLEEALACFRHEPDDEEVASVLAIQAQVAHARGDWAGAEAIYRRVLAIRRDSAGHQRLLVPTTLTDLAKVLANAAQGRTDEAEALLLEAIELERLRFPEDHPNISNKKVELAFVLWRGDQPDRAFALAQDGYRDMSARFGEENLSVAPSLTLLGALHHQRGDLGQAEELLRRALALQRRGGQAGSNAIAYTLSTLGRTLLDKGDAAGSVECFADALAIREGVYGATDPQTAHLAASLCSAQRRAGDFEGAKASIEKALAIYRNVSGEKYEGVSLSLLTLGHIEKQLNDLAAAEEHYARVIAIGDEAGDTVAPHRIDGIYWLATLRRNDGRPAEAAPLYREVAALLEADEPPPIGRLSIIWSNLGDCLVAMERYDEAEVVLLEGYRRTSAEPDHDAGSNRTVREALVRLYHATGQPEKAKPYQSPAKTSPVR